MNSELPLSADALLAERARLEEVLQSSEDWCELLRLKSRKDRGEGMSAVNAARLEMVLIDALAEDPNFVRYKAVCVALERLIRGLPPLPAKGTKAPVEKDDLTEIDGITASMQRRLNALDVMTFIEIAEWTPADVKSISADLGIGRQIFEQDWIGQAEELATRSDEPVQSVQPAAPPRAAPPAKQAVIREPQLERAPPQQPSPREVPKPVIQPQPIASRAVEEPARDVKPTHVAKPAEIKPEPALSKPVEAARAELPPAAVKEGPPVSNAAPKPANAEPAKAQETPSKRAVADLVSTPDRKAETTDAKSAEHATQQPKDDANRARAIEQSPSPILPPSADSKLLADPPRPLKAGVYKPEPQVLPAKDKAADSVPARPLPSPPQPLRVQEAVSKPAIESATVNVGARGGADVLKLASPDLSAAFANLTPPRPLVVTRASLPLTAKAEIPPAAPVVARQPEPPVRSADSAVRAPLPRPALPPPSAQPFTASAPTMSIAEAIAYAAEVARQSPKTSDTKTSGIANNDQRRAAATPVNGTAIAASPVQQPKLEPARPPVSALQTPAQPKPQPAPPARASAQSGPATPSVPPPLPQGFVPPPDDSAFPEPLEHRGTKVQSSRFSDRDDNAGQRLSAEEATVEIVVKSAPEIRPTPRATLSKVATETTASAPRPATPIGRFLKALTGN